MQTANYPPAVLTKAFTWAYEELGLSAADAAQLLGIKQHALQQTALVGFPDNAPQTHLQLAFIRFYYQLITVFSGDADRMRHWFHTFSPSLQSPPKSMCDSEEGLTRLIENLTLLDRETQPSPANDNLSLQQQHVG